MSPDTPGRVRDAAGDRRPGAVPTLHGESRHTGRTDGDEVVLELPLRG